MRYQLTDDGVHSMNHRSQPMSSITKTPPHCHPSRHLTPPSLMQSSSLAGYKARSIPYHHQAKANDGGLKDPWGPALFSLASSSSPAGSGDQADDTDFSSCSFIGGGGGILLTQCGARSAYAPLLMPANHLFAPSTNPSRNLVKRCCGAVPS
jgi:hypothetical protein